jgi:DNA polymerase III delta prime subunit
VKSKNVDPVKCPRLHAALVRMEARENEGWKRVVELRRTGQDGSASRLVRKLLGVQGEPMSEETKEKLRQYNEEHAEEIKERKQQEREIQRRTIALLTTGKKGTGR